MEIYEQFYASNSIFPFFFIVFHIMIVFIYELFRVNGFICLPLHVKT